MTAAVAVICGVALAKAEPYSLPTDRVPDPAYVGEGLFLGPFIFSPSIFVGVGYDSNFANVARDEVVDIDPDGDGTRTPVAISPTGDSITITRARLALKLPYSHSYASLIWTPQYRVYGNYRANLKTSHDLQFENRLNFSNGSWGVIRNGFQDGFTDVKSIDRTQGEARLASIPFRRNRPQLEYAWAWANGWGVEGILERTSYVYGRTEGIELQTQGSGSSGGERGLFDLFDYDTNSLEGKVYKDFTNYRLYGSVQVAVTAQDRTKFNESRPDIFCSDRDGDGTGDPCPNSERIDQADASLGIRGRIFPRTVAEIEVGYTTWNFKTGDILPFSGVSFSSRIEHTINPMTIVSLAAERTPQQASGQFAGYYSSTEVGTIIERKLTMRVSARVGLEYLRTYYPGSEGRDDRFTIEESRGTLELRYSSIRAAVKAPLALAVFYMPERTRSTLDYLNVDADRFGVSLQYGWF